MNAQATRIGGSYIARGRGAFDTPVQVATPILGSDHRSPMIERLSVESLVSIANFMKIKICDLTERYQ